MSTNCLPGTRYQTVLSDLQRSFRLYTPYSTVTGFRLRRIGNFSYALYIIPVFRRGEWQGRVLDKTMRHQQVIENFIKEGIGGRGTNVKATENLLSSERELNIDLRCQWKCTPRCDQGVRGIPVEVLPQ